MFKMLFYNYEIFYQQNALVDSMHVIKHDIQIKIKLLLFVYISVKCISTTMSYGKNVLEIKIIFFKGRYKDT